jgi:hypothetical protein
MLIIRHASHCYYLEEFMLPQSYHKDATNQFIRFKTWLFLNQFATLYEVLRFHPSNGATAQIGPWPPLLRFHNNVLQCEVVSLTTNPR